MFEWKSKVTVLALAAMFCAVALFNFSRVEAQNSTAPTAQPTPPPAATTPTPIIDDDEPSHY